jgi:hypothetical protein
MRSVSVTFYFFAESEGCGLEWSEVDREPSDLGKTRPVKLQIAVSGKLVVMFSGIPVEAFPDPSLLPNPAAYLDWLRPSAGTFPTVSEKLAEQPWAKFLGLCLFGQRKYLRQLGRIETLAGERSVRALHGRSPFTGPLQAL